MKPDVTHLREAETPEAKARWFQSLSMQERAEIFNAFVEMILEINPTIAEQKVAEPIAGRVRVVSKS